MEDLAVFKALTNSGSFGKNLFKCKKKNVIYRLRVGIFKTWVSFSPYGPPSRQITYIYVLFES